MESVARLCRVLLTEVHAGVTMVNGLYERKRLQPSLAVKVRFALNSKYI